MSVSTLDGAKTNFLGEQYQMPILAEGAESAEPLEQAVARHEILTTSNGKIGGDLIVDGDIILKGSDVTELKSADDEVTGRLAIVENAGKYELQFIVTKPTGKSPIVLEDNVTNEA